MNNWIIKLSIMHTLRYPLLLFSLFLFLQTNIKAQSNDNATGWIRFDTNIEQFYLIIDEDFENHMLLNSGDSVEVPVGSHQIRMVWNNINDHRSRLVVKENQTTVKNTSFFVTRYPRSSFNIIESSRNVVITTDNESDIYVDGNYVGSKYSEILLAPGVYDLEIKNAVHGDLETKFFVEAYKVKDIARYNNDPTPVSIFVKLLPGGGYIGNEQYLKAGLTYAGLIGLTITSVSLNNQYGEKERLFQEQNTNYLNAQTVNAAISFREDALFTLDEMDKLNRQLTIAGVGIAVVYLATTLDGFRKPKAGYSGPSLYLPEIGLNTNPVNGNMYTEISFKKSF
jgi:hypothetical protein